jgi:hypothetical protein
MTSIANMNFSEGRSFLTSRQIGFGHAFVQCKELSRLRTVPRYWDEHFLLYEPMQIASGCCYQGMPKLLFRRRLRRPHWLRTSQRLLPATVDVTVAGIRATSTTGGDSTIGIVATPASGQKRNALPYSHQGFIKSLAVPGVIAAFQT